MVADNFKNSRRFIEMLPCKLRFCSAWRPSGFGRFGLGAGFRATCKPPSRHELTEILFLHEHRADDNQSLPHQLDIGVDVLKLKNVRQQSEDQHADESAGEKAAPAYQPGAAAHHRG